METVGTRFQCLVESSVFNGDAGLICQAHGEFNGILIKVVAAFAEDIECSKHARPCLHWQTHQGPSSLSLNRCSMFREEPLLSRGIRSDAGFATRRHMASRAPGVAPTRISFLPSNTRKPAFFSKTIAVASAMALRMVGKSRPRV